MDLNLSQDGDWLKRMYIPKVIIFATLLPYYEEFNQLLEYLYIYCNTKNIYSPIEKILEKIITNLPLPLNLASKISINLSLPTLDQKIITFPQLNVYDLNIDSTKDIPLISIFDFFQVEDVIKLFRYMIYEIPILFFSEDINILSLFITVFPSVLSPFKYAYPIIPILPQKYYGLMNSEISYIFGITQIRQFILIFLTF